MPNSNQDLSTQVIESIHVENDHAVVSSRAIAEHFDRPHYQVLRDIERIECSEEFKEYNFVLSSYQAGNRHYKCYNLTKDGFVFLAMGFTGKKAAKFKEAYITAFNAMEATLVKGQQAQLDPSRYHFPLETASPSDRVFTNAIMTPARLLSNRAPEMELITLLEQEGYNVDGVKLRLEALHRLAEYQDLYNQMFHELHASLDRTTKLAEQHKNTVWGKNVSFTGTKRIGYEGI